jgi:ATP-dependent DNA helicase DinG
MEQMRARTSEAVGSSAARNAPPARRPTWCWRPRAEAAQAMAALEAPLLALARHLEDVLDEEADLWPLRAGPDRGRACAASTAAPA